MLFESPHANLQVICSNTKLIRHPNTGDVIETIPGIWANFGKLGDQYEFMNPETHEMMTGAAISGHFYDTDVEAAENGWDSDTKEMVERKLVGLCRKQPDRIKLIEREATAAAPPWPTYDDCDADQAITLASQLGLVAEALAYERENRERPAVLDALAASLDAEQEIAANEPAVGPNIDPVKLEKLSRTITV